MPRAYNYATIDISNRCLFEQYESMVFHFYTTIQYSEFTPLSILYSFFFLLLYYLM